MMGFCLAPAGELYRDSEAALHHSAKPTGPPSSPRWLMGNYPSVAAVVNSFSTSWTPRAA